MKRISVFLYTCLLITTLSWTTQAKTKHQTYLHNKKIMDQYEKLQREKYNQYVRMVQLQQLQQFQQMQYYNQMQQMQQNQASSYYYNGNTTNQQNNFAHDQMTRSYLNYNSTVNNDTARMRMGLSRR